MPVNGIAKGRFELPALTPVIYSLTDGTDIPPPPDSPIEEKQPAPKTEPADAATAPAVNGVKPTTAANGVQYDGRGRTDTPPLSPASSTRPNSIRRFLSRRSLNANYKNGTNHNGSQEDLSPGAIERPNSRTSFVKNRRSSGSWFKRFTGGSPKGNRTSIIYENGPSEKKPMGPPPPKLPELNQLKAKLADDDAGSLGGGTMFENIR